MRLGWRPSGFRPRPRPPTGDRCTGPHGGPRTTCAAAPTWRIPSRASRPTRTLAPMCSMPRASPVWRRSASSSRPSTGRSTSWPAQGASVGEPAAAGVGRVSAGGAFAFAAVGAVVEAATELREAGVQVLAACPRRLRRHQVRLRSVATRRRVWRPGAETVTTLPPSRTWQAGTDVRVRSAAWPLSRINAD